MPIPIHREDPEDPPVERCCFCRNVTPFWTSLSDRKGGQQVACCEHCAGRGDPVDVPTKDQWCRRERIAHRPTIGEISQGRDRNYPPPPITNRP